MIRSLKLGVLGVAVLALLAFAPSAFASTLTEANGIVTWTAAISIANNTTFSDTATTIVIDTADDPVTYTDAGGQITPSCVDSDGAPTDGSADQVTCTGVTTVVANSEDLNDTEDASALASHPITVNGGDGNDTINTGAMNDTLNGEGGDDDAEGGPGADSISGGDGNDQLCGAACGAGPVTGDGADTISGGAGDDSGQGQVGNDVIDMGDGDDFAGGGPGNDVINLGNGNDGAGGGPGNDTINGGAGDDFESGDCFSLNACTGTDGNDTLNGDDGSDQLEGDGGNDTSTGGAGDDMFFEPNDGGSDVDNGGDGFDDLQYFTVSGAADVVNISQDGQANDGLTTGAGSLSQPDGSNNFGGDIEQFDTFAGQTPVHAALASINNTINTNGTGGDTVDAGPGADNVNVFGGDDTVNAVDGYPDTINCGDGNDTANVDQFDTTFNCETVHVASVKSAFQDAPPTVSWVAPANGATLSANTTTPFQARATDDKGISKVVFQVGTRVVCTATTPGANSVYSCNYSPTSADVGKNILIVTAYDTANQTATAIETMNLTRFNARSLTARTRPKKDTTFPFVFTTSGKLNLPAGVDPKAGCVGRVQVQFRTAKKTISSRKVALRRDCTYSSRVKFRIPSRLHPKSLEVLVRWLGNAVVNPKKGPTGHVAV